jgi:hypothetical protein
MDDILQNEKSLKYKFAVENECYSKYVFFYKKFYSVFDIFSDDINEQPNVDLYNESKINSEDVFYACAMFYSKFSTNLFDVVTNVLDGIITSPTSKSEFQNKYDEWRYEFNNGLNEDRKIYSELTKYINEIKELNKKCNFLVSKFNIEKGSFYFSPTINTSNGDRRDATLEDGLEIFDKLLVSKYIPYVCYTDTITGEYYKVYDDSRKNINLDKKFFEEYVTKNPKKGLFEIIFWDGERYGFNVKKTLNQNFIKIEYDLNFNKMIIKDIKRGTSIMSKEKMTNIIANAFPNIDLRESTDLKLSGKFQIFGVKFNDLSFVNSLFSDKLINKFLFIEEGSAAYGQKVRIDLYYKELLSDENEGNLPNKNNGDYISSTSDIYFTIAKRTLDEKFSVALNTNEIREISPGTEIVEITISNSKNIEEIDRFIFTIKNLLFKYNNIKKSIETKISKFLEETSFFGNERTSEIYESDVEVSDDEDEEEEEDIDEIFDELETLSEENEEGEEDPKQYKIKKTANLKALQLKFPEIFEKNKYPKQCSHQPFLIESENEAAAFRSSGIDVHKFPHNAKGLEPKCNLYCDPKNKYKFFGVKENKMGTNKAKYPYIPCCYLYDQTQNTNYLNYLAGIAPQKTIGTRSSNIIKSDAILGEFGTGKLAITIGNVLKLLYPNEFLRYGAIIDHNSFLHCVLMAIDDKDYYLLNKEKKIKYAHELRKKIINSINISVVMQEMYDYDQSTIYKMLESETFFDPYLFYRLVEEYFGLNIFVFTKISSEKMEIPRHKYFHCRYRNDRKCILIHKSDLKDEDIKYPQCELIFTNIDGRQKFLFDSEMSNYCFNLIEKINMTIVATLPQNNMDMKFDKRIKLFTSSPNFEELFPRIISQSVDSHGKLRHFTFKGDTKMTIFTIPYQPLNCEISSDIVYSNPDTVISFFEELSKYPSGISIGERKEGIWFDYLGIEKGFFVVCNFSLSDTFDTQKFTHFESPINVKTSSKLDKYISMKKIASVMCEYVKWVFSVANYNGDMDPTIFCSNKFEIRKTKYDISGIERRMPNVKDANEAMNYLEIIMPSFVEDGKFIIEDMNLYKSLYFMLNRFYNSRNLFQADFKNTISSYYSSVYDLNINQDTYVFHGYKNIVDWLRIKNTININFTLQKNVVNTENYFVYITDKGVLYIFQRINGKTVKRCITSWENWNKFGINAGSNLQPSEIVPYKIYGISIENFELEIKSDSSNDENVFCEIFIDNENSENFSMLKI